MLIQLLIASTLATFALAEPDPSIAPAAPPTPDLRWNAETGRTGQQFPPPVWFDHQSMVLELSIADMRTPTLEGVLTLTSTAVGRPRDTLVLDARDSIAISAITIDGLPQPLIWSHENAKLTITLPAPVPPGQSITTRITYAATNTSTDGAGLVWLTGVGRDGDRKREPQIFSQGQANWNSHWFPCHDFPNDRLASTMIVTAPADFQVISNGRLTAKDQQPDGRTRWTWVQTRPHPADLVMLAVAKFDVVDGGGPTSARPGLDMPVYGPVGSAERLTTIFKRTPDMIAYFEQLLDEPYPWDKYAQVIVRGFRWGGMENTSATILAEYAAAGRAGDHEDLIAHEIIHQWLGNLITCKSWEHLWLNEGWATFGEWLWIEHTQGRAAYDKAVEDARRAVTVMPTSLLPLGVPVVSNLYGEPDDTFTKPEDPYVKGGLFLHTLRQRLGDDTFWRGVRLYIDTHKDSSVETDDFRHIMEAVSGQSLERFFDQWIKRPGVPRLRVTTTTGDQPSTTTITIEQVQDINERNPAWAFALPIWLKLQDGSERWITIDTDQRLARQTLTLPSPIDTFRVDPRVTVMMDLVSSPRRTPVTPENDQ
ncbi:MAG: M1 family metallopeptidase [Phycisphaerales bacterium]|nr:M1 family metallopeptidase [Phycisphaerales bacterium]